MAYFSNGTEGMMYDEKYCSRCANMREHPADRFGDVASCAVWDLHQLYNYDQNRKTKTGKIIADFLSTLIPNEENSHWPAECSMFLEAKPKDDPEMVYLDGLREGVKPITDLLRERDIKESPARD